MAVLLSQNKSQPNQINQNEILSVENINKSKYLQQNLHCAWLLVFIEIKNLKISQQKYFYFAISRLFAFFFIFYQHLKSIIMPTPNFIEKKLHVNKKTDNL